MEVFMAKHQDLTGKIFGRLTVLELDRVTDKGHYFWLCRCECGNLCSISTGGLNRGTGSCGCIKREMLQKRNSTHGMADTSLYAIWCGIKSRCDVPSNKAYKNYGGRGITYCEKWKTFEGFYEDMNESYKSWLTIDRINNDGNYCKENCRWVDSFTQASNTRKNKYVEYEGETYTVSQLARKFGMKPQTLNKRLVLKWSIEKSLNTPIK